MSEGILFWTVALFLLVWAVSYAGLVVFTFIFSTPDHWEKLVSEGRILQAYADYIAQIPTWVVWLTYLAAGTRLAGASALVLKSSVAAPMLAVSLLFVAILMFRGFVLAGVARVIRRSQVMLELVFLGLSVFSTWFALRYGG